MDIGTLFCKDKIISDRRLYGSLLTKPSVSYDLYRQAFYILLCRVLSVYLQKSREQKTRHMGCSRVRGRGSWWAGLSAGKLNWGLV